MHPIAGYLLTLVCGGILVSLIHSISSSSGAGKSLLEIICGIFMAFLVIAPLHDMDFQIPELSWDTGADLAQQAAGQGIGQAESELNSVISRETAAYILDKAGTLGAHLEVEVIVDPQTHRPARVMLTGHATYRQQIEISHILEEDLSIERRNQIWQVPQTD